MNPVAIIGAGCAGLTAALYLSRADIIPFIFTGTLQDKGGLLTKTSIVENYPGFPEGILGFDLMEKMEEQVKKYNGNVIDRMVTGIQIVEPTEAERADGETRSCFRVFDDRGEIYLFRSVIIATGSKPQKLGLPREETLWGRGISSCAICDGALYRNRPIIVIGGGDSAMEEALFLTKFSRVTLIHRRDTFRASPIMIKRVLENPLITIRYNTVVVSLEGDDNNCMSAIVVKNLLTNQQETLPVDGLFYGLGLKPTTELFKDLVERDPDGYIKVLGEGHNQDEGQNTHYSTMTNTEGIFVAGDATDRIYRQAVVAAGDGCKAALDVQAYLSHH